MKLLIYIKLFVAASLILSIASAYYFDTEKQEEDNQFKKSIFLLIGSVILILPFFLIRAYIIQFFPFTNKVESFITLYMMILFIAVIYHNDFKKNEFISFLTFGFISATAAMLFQDRLGFPSPMLRTIWFPLHVPLSFLAYAFWIAAGIKSFFIHLNKTKDSSTIIVFNRYGFIAFSLSMIFGGIWGYLAWGAYFMWDPKILWSAILWVYYGNLVHLELIPDYKKYKHVLYSLGILIIIITFIGTGFFSRSIHRF